MAAQESSTPTIVVHGGAWAIPDSLAEASRAGVKAAGLAGYKILSAGGSAVDAVEAAVRSLEDDVAFDAGHGAVLNAAGEVELDAMIMRGSDLGSGAVACVQNIANPISLARTVMEKTDHCLLVGKGANAFAREQGIPEVDDLVTPAAKEEWERFMKFNTTVNVLFRKQGDQEQSVPSGCDTVGAVAIDQEGNMACGTSTGGITAKRPGRVGDSPIIGSGAYCDNAVGGVSTTGHGEGIMRVCLARRILENMERGTETEKATASALDYMNQRLKSHGGAVVLSHRGDVAACFTTERMAWASVKNSQLNWGLDPSEKNSVGINS